MYERLEVYIETLTGTAFELRVSPYETIQDVKARIQKLEGIPINQQHLIWQSVELEDHRCLSDYKIHDGATLRLVLSVRGGPINTRRIPMDDPTTLREMAEYLSEANKDDLIDKVSNRPVTVIVYHNGDQLNFFRLVDRDSTSPMSESLSGASVYNLYDEDEDEEGATREKYEEHEKTREKMKLLRLKMENLTVSKKPKKKVPRPPSSGRPSSKSRLRHQPISSGGRKSASLNRNKCLPPLGKTLKDSGPQLESTSGFDPGNIQAAKELFHSAAAAAAASNSSDNVKVPPLGIRRLESVESAKLKPSLTSVREHQTTEEEERDGKQQPGVESAKASTSTDTSTNCDSNSPSDKKDIGLSKETILKRAQSSLRASRKYDFSTDVLLRDGPKPPASPRKSREPYVSHPNTSAKELERLLENAEINGPGRPPSQSHGGVHGPSRQGGRSSSNSSSRYADRRQGGGVVLESLNESEVRTMSSMLSSLVRSASKPRPGYTLGSNGYSEMGRIPTPEGRRVSARLRLSASRDGRGMSARLPPVKQKKKSKRCFVCDKKTGLTNSYPCRCSHNFCATHRYPEAHNCTFDYKTEGRKLLEQNNPVVSAPKLPKI